MRDNKNDSDIININKLKDQKKNKEIIIDTFAESIEEEIKKENLEALWRKYGKTVSIVTTAIMVGIIVNNYWKKQDLEDRMAVSHALTIAQSMMLSGNVQNAEIQLHSIATSKKADYAALAKLSHAAILQNKGDKNAIDEYLKIYNDHKIDMFFRNVSYIFYVNCSLNMLDFNSIRGKIKEMVDKLSSKDILEGPWRPLAMLTLGFCYIAMHDDEKANKVLAELAKLDDVPAEISEFARSLIK